MRCFGEFFFFSAFLFVLGDNIFFVDAVNGLDSNDGHTEENATQSLHGALASSLPQFQKVYVLPGLYAEFGFSLIEDRDVEIVGSIRSGISYNFMNTSADDYTVESGYDVDDIETVINYREDDEYMVSLTTARCLSVRRVRFVGIKTSALFMVYTGTLTVRRCYFAGNCSCFHLNDTQANLNISWSVFRPNNWNDLTKVIITHEFAFNSITIGGSLFRSVKNATGDGVVLGMNNANVDGKLLTIKDSDFRNCEGRYGGVLYVWRTKDVEIVNSSFYYNRADGRGAVLFLDGPAPPDSSFHMEKVWLDHNLCGNTGNFISVRNISSDYFSTSTVIDVSVNIASPINYLFAVFNTNNQVLNDITFLLIFTTWAEGSIFFTTGLTDGTHLLLDWVDYDLLANYTQSDTKPSPKPATPSTPVGPPKKGVSAEAAGGIVGGIWGFVVVVIVAIVVVYCCCYGPKGCGCAEV